MAETYGTKPKKFTAEWWPYFWCYYKWFVITIAALIIVLCGLGYHIYKMEQYDLTLTYAGPHYFPGNHIEQISEEYAKICEDVTHDGKKLLSFATITISDQDVDPEYKSSMMISLQFALEEEEKYIFIIHKDYASRYLAQSAETSRYEPADNWLTADVGDAEKLSAHGYDYGISLANNKMFEKWNCDLSDHYLLIRQRPKDKSEIPAYEAAIKLANKLLEQ